MTDEEVEERFVKSYPEFCTIGNRQPLSPYWDLWEAGTEYGFNKANEWHYPSKGELPKCDEETQLMFYVNCYYEVDGETKIRKRTVLGFYKKSFMNDDVKLFVEKSKGYEEEHLPQAVIAWKEIVLPEESK